MDVIIEYFVILRYSLWKYLYPYVCLLVSVYKNQFELISINIAICSYINMVMLINYSFIEIFIHLLAFHKQI